jgi:hypothetical protein
MSIFKIVAALALAVITTVPSHATTVPPNSSDPSYRRGSNDRDAWESWINAQQGLYLDGATWWANNRNNPSRNGVTCEQASMSPEWIGGCNAARRMLTPTDFMRQTDAQYWNGWNKKPPFVPGIPGETASGPTAPPYVPTPAPDRLVDTSPAALTAMCVRIVARQGLEVEAVYDEGAGHFTWIGDSVARFRWQQCMINRGTSFDYNSTSR